MDPGFAKGDWNMASMEHEPITGVWGRAPGGVKGPKSPEAESFSPEAESFWSIFIQKRN